MTFEEVAQTITPTGYGAAIVGLFLCIVVLSIRFRARNIARETAPSTALNDTKPQVPPVELAPPSQPESLFKAFSPADATAADASDVVE